MLLPLATAAKRPLTLSQEIDQAIATSKPMAGAEIAIQIVHLPDGKVLYRHMNGRGSNLSLTGQPPLSLVIGNATQVSMTYGGRPLDLKPYIDANVARFNLEE